MGSLQGRGESLGIGLRGKKGIYFTIVSIVLASVVFFAFGPESDSSSRVDLVEYRAESANDFVKSVKTFYIPSAIKISGHKAAKAVFSEYKASGGEFNSRRAEDFFSDLVANGTAYKNGNYVSVEDFIKTSSNSKTLQQLRTEYENASLDSLFEAIDQQASYLRADVDFDYSNYSIRAHKHPDPDKFVVDATVNFNVSTELASWNVSETYSVVLDRQGIDLCFNSSNRSCFDSSAVSPPPSG